MTDEFIRMSASMKKRLDGRLEAGLRKAKRKRSKSEEALAKEVQKHRHKRGAAQSPTPPPKASFSRDEKTLEILQSIEHECVDDGYVLVGALAQKYLFEQNQLNPKIATVPMVTDDSLFSRLNELVENPDTKLEKAIRGRIRLRTKLIDEAVPIYGWDKCTHLLRSCFISWSMNPGATIPFTVNLSPEAVEGAHRSKVGFATHLQDRMRKIIKRKLGGWLPAFWFVVERGTKSGFHIHGAISCGTGASAQKAVKQALRSFSGLSDRNAVYLSPAGQRLRWSAYCSKYSITTQKLLKSDTFAATMDCRRQGKQMYEAFQSEVRDWRQRNK